ncbi:unnamed protein product [Durusdinium trenchii]|uniref:RRM domain-containing protein n=1 Tax=Durusdinium trenchii TaxID=1381693 RepID=A0ABP0JVW4_9DINO
MPMTAPGMAPSMPGAPMLVPVPAGHPLPATLPSLPPLTMPPPTSGATVSIAIDHLPFRYQLSEADLKETFQRWGTVQSVQVVRDGGNDVGCVQFADPVDAQDAQKQLTGQSCTFDGRQGTLVLVMGSPFQLQNRQVPGQAGPGPVAAPLSAPSACGPGAPKNGSPVKGDGKGIAPVNGHVRPTWCCKIVVEAESLHPKFPTAQRIRGDGDANLEHIRTQTKCHVQLRGRNSGTPEPETGQELPEQMFLWLTSDSAENGKASLETTMDLLKSIYEGHQQWCETNGIGVKDVKARVIENPEILPGSLAAGASMGQVVPPPPNSFGPCKGSPPGKGPGPY